LILLPVRVSTTFFLDLNRAIGFSST